MCGKQLRLIMTVSLMMGVAGTAHGVLITVDPDAFSVGTNISSAFAGVTLSSVGSGFDGDFDPNIFSINSAVQSFPFTASTGSLVFGTNDNTFPAVFGGWGGAMFRVDFATPTSQVLLDAIGNNSSDYAQLNAYNSGGTLVDSYSTGQLTTSVFETMGVSGAGIAYVIASGVAGDSVGFDQLRYEEPGKESIIPEPSTMLLLSLGLSGLAAKRKFLV